MDFFDLDLADQLKRMRRRNGWSQERAAGWLRCSVRTLQGWEQSRRVPRGVAAAYLREKVRHFTFWI